MDSINEQVKPIKISLDVTGRESWHNSFTVEYEGATRRVPMLAFQHELDTPKTIECIVSPSASGIKFRQNLANLAQQFYQIGETYSFRIKNDQSEGKGPNINVWPYVVLMKEGSEETERNWHQDIIS